MAFLAPATLPLFAAELGTVGAGVSAVGTIAGGESTAHTANYQAAVAANNAAIENQNATYAEEAGEAKAQAVGLQGASAAGKIKTQMAANNLDVNTGSPVSVEKSQAETAQLDTETMLNNSLLTAYGYRTQATNETAQAGLETAEGEEAPISADLAAGGGLLANASSLGFKWSGLLKDGTSNPTFNLTGELY